MIPSPWVLVCWFRCLYRSIKLGKMVSGCEFSEIVSAGQPRHVQVLVCRTCGTDSLAWTRCNDCGRDS